MPAVAGIEGFGVIEETGRGVTSLRSGDWVVPAHSAVGCWRTFGNHAERDLFKIGNDIPFESAATFQINPPTAFRMLKDFAVLQPGDLVVQNGANSNVGRCVIQVCLFPNKPTHRNHTCCIQSKSEVNIFSVTHLNSVSQKLLPSE
ncbi:unnamed protein product [Gongylonema pulchrum]|uniref:Enoyl-[acyl-carrier-protein] reductase, mitochondrial n=1 Tax=Gongylonema pulchrum TaxID=637853 RepID=A0A3P6QCL2_9BILA|nr:unnamed protein product [Gongylonema pulchrum]